MTTRTRPTSKPDTTDVLNLDAVAMVVVDQPNTAACEYPLRVGTAYEVGRSSRAAIPLSDDYVSRAHGLIRYDEKTETWMYQDLGSANGSFHNGKLVKGPVTLRPGDVIDLGVQKQSHLHIVGANDATSLTSAGSSGRAADALAALFSSPSWQEIEDAITRASRRMESVLIVGPGGSGKTTIARRIHQESKARGDFIPVSCGRLPSDPLWLKQFFLGSPGGKDDQKPIVELAENGTLFLDDVHELSPAAQMFLMDMLDAQGSSFGLGRPGTPRVRLIYASPVPLAATDLRPDIRERMLGGVSIIVPPLKERRDVIPAYLSLFLRNFEIARGKHVEITLGASNVLRSYDWPGEVRELQAVVHQLLVDAVERAELAPNTPLVITEKDVRSNLTHRMMALGEIPGDRPVAFSSNKTMQFERAPDGTLVPAGSVKKSARALTRDDVENALRAHNYNIFQTARALDIARNTLRAKIAAFNISMPTSSE